MPSSGMGPAAAIEAMFTMAPLFLRSMDGKTNLVITATDAMLTLTWPQMSASVTSSKYLGCEIMRPTLFTAKHKIGLE